MVKEIKQYQATDGTCFGTRVEAEQYEEMLQNPHFKQLKEKVEQLERTVNHLQYDLTIERSKDPFKDIMTNRPPYQQPAPMLYNGDDRVPLSHEAYNPATGGKL